MTVVYCQAPDGANFETADASTNKQNVLYTKLWCVAKYVHCQYSDCNAGYKRSETARPALYEGPHAQWYIGDIQGDWEEVRKQRRKTCVCVSMVAEIELLESTNKKALWKVIKKGKLLTVNFILFLI
jgi:hypothetical protein